MKIRTLIQIVHTMRRENKGYYFFNYEALRAKRLAGFCATHLPGF